MTNWLAASFRNLRDDERGNFTLVMGIAAPTVLILVAGLVNYSNTITMQQKTQSAADAASLAATTAFANGNVTTAASAQSVANAFFLDNAPAQAVQGQTSFSAVTTVPSTPGAGRVSTTVSFCGKTASLVGWVGGSLNKFCTSSTTSASVTIGNNGSARVYGDAVNWGDPHEDGANGVDFEAHCTPGTWYVIFSDANMQMNGLCETYYSSTAEGFSDLSLTVGGHQVYVTNFTHTSGSFQSSVDGISSSQTSNGMYTLFNSPSGYSMSLNVSHSNRPDDSYNYYQLNTPNYVVTINYSDDGVISIATANLNYNACAIPAGLLGQTFGPANAMDTSGFDFSVPGGSNNWYVSPNYSATCLAVTSSSEAHITR